MLKASLGKASGIAISGPNALEISFPKSYHFNLEYCQRRDQMARLEAVLAEVVGRQVGISLKLAADPPQMARPAAGNGSAAEVKRRVDPEADPLVKKALDVFNATVVKVEER